RALLRSGSWGGLRKVPILAFLLGIRIGIEENTLRTGLEGYDDYARRVRWRLVPFIWWNGGLFRVADYFCHRSIGNSVYVPGFKGCCPGSCHPIPMKMTLAPIAKHCNR